MSCIPRASGTARAETRGELGVDRGAASVGQRLRAIRGGAPAAPAAVRSHISSGLCSNFTEI